MMNKVTVLFLGGNAECSEESDKGKMCTGKGAAEMMSKVLLCGLGRGGRGEGKNLSSLSDEVALCEG